MNPNNSYLIWDKIDGVYIAEFPNRERALHFIDYKKYGYKKGGYMAKGEEAGANKKIKDFYIDKYPMDELGVEINEKSTFNGLYKVLDNKGDVYHYIGVSDSLVRERVFEKLADTMGVEYDEIYQKWLDSDDEYKKGGYMEKGNLIGQNIDVFGYTTQNFDMCPLAVEEFEKAIDAIGQTDSDAKKTALSRAAMYVDDVLGVEKRAKEDNIVSKNEFQYAVTQSLVASAYNYASGLEVNLTKFLPMHIFEIATKLIHAEPSSSKEELTAYDLLLAKDKVGEQAFKNMTVEERKNLARQDKISFEEGGSVQESNYRMVLSQAKAIKHHADELMEVLTPDMEVEAWVVGKIERASTDMSDITHYLDGLVPSSIDEEVGFEEGGQLEKGVYYLGKPKKEGLVWGQKIVELDENGLSFATDYATKLKDFPSKDYKKITEEELSEFIKNSPKHHNVSSDPSKFEHYANGGMIAGRWYRDNQGVEYRYVGEDSTGQSLFSDGQKVSRKSLDDFESDTKEKKSFSWFKEGGMMAQGGQLNVEIRKLAQKEGFTPKALGKDYQKVMAQAAVEALTDANFHDESRKLISLLENKPEWAKKPNFSELPRMGSKEYEEWRASSVYSSEYNDADEKTRDFAIKVSQESGYDGQAIANAFEYLLKVEGGYHKIAGDIKKAMEGSDKMAKGGGIYSSDGLYYLQVLKDGEEVGREKFRAKSLKEAKEIAEDDYEKDYQSKFGDHLSFIVSEAMAEGGETDNWKKTRTRKLKTKEEAEKAIKLFAQNMGKAGRNYKVEKMDDGYVISYESNFTEAMAKGGYVAVSEKDGYWYIMSKPTTKDLAEQLISLGVPMGEEGKVVTIDEAKSHKKVIGAEYLADGGKVKEIDMDEVESSAKFYTDESKWSTKPTIKKFQDDIDEYETLKSKLDKKEITPSKVIGTGYKSQLARPLAYRWLNERILVAKRAIEILKERGEKMAMGGEVDEKYEIELFFKGLSGDNRKIGKYVVTQKTLDNLEDEWSHVVSVDVIDETDKKPITWYELKKDLYSKGKEKGFFAKGGKLIGKQKNLDVNKNGKLDAEDFKMLRGEKMADGGEVGGRGWGNYEKGKRITNINELKVGESYLSYNKQFNAKNIIRITSGDKTPLKRDIVYGGFVRNKNDKKVEGDFAIWGYELKDLELYEIKDKMAMGGKVKFEDKVKAIKASLLKSKKVPKKVQKDYGKTYSPKEAEAAAKRIAGSMRKKEMK
jgi:hypothetical protein